MEPGRFHQIYDAPVWMEFPERVALYSTVFGRRPQRTLEIGTFRGGSAAIIVAALDDVGAGELICVDPNPQVDPELWARLAHRATMVAGPSPDILAGLAPTAALRFELTLIDGDHGYDGVARDIEGVLPVLADEAYALFHDAHYHEVAAAIDAALSRHPAELVDCGLISTLEVPEAEEEGKRRVVWGGLRMLRFQRQQG
jgi:predicted O-methyltransferase YrrM